MTAKELVLKRAPNWSEEDAEVALRAVEHRHQHQHQDKPGDIVDVWGNLDAQTDATTAASMHDLDEQEMAELGETISEAWGYESSR